jgi:hypothetical protein
VHWDNWKHVGYVHVIAAPPGAEDRTKKRAERKDSQTRREKERIKITRENSNEQGKQE